MNLTTEQKQHLYEDGYVKLPAIVPRDRVDAALQAINASLGANGIDPAKLTTLRAQTYTPELRDSAPITDLLNMTPIHSAAESAIGSGQVKPTTGGQIALRFPVDGAPTEPRPHIDGMYSPANGVKEGTISNFTALVGVLLSDLPGPYGGNFTVWPGSHRRFEEYFRTHGAQALLEGMPKVELPEPLQVTGQVGDAFLVHYQLAHGIAGNSSPHIRYAIFFRLHHVDHEQVHWKCMTDIWREWSGMREVLSTASR
ncbi:MAG: phytanoyl-CoA dioxygenase family protein [Chloroflexota bacterium]|nr:phytanoyl-CoA dioxygenase family protein [Chloroflexota bacterium]